MFSMMPLRVLALLACAICDLSSAQVQWEMLGLPPGLSPRSVEFAPQELQLQNRQAGTCGADEHSCLDINAPTVCCPNNSYCVINSDYKPGCCALGSNCGLPCGSSQYQCHSTASARGTASVVPACCPRSCEDVGLYKCAATLGPGCCSLGFDCVKGGGCASSVQAASTGGTVGGGCAGGQSSCTGDGGGGCCGAGQTCTVSGNGYYCAGGETTARRTGVDGSVETGEAVMEVKRGGLSTAAKAGIGGGVGGGVLLLVAGVLFFCMRQRRNHRAITESSSVPSMSQKADPAPTESPQIWRQTADYSGPTATAGPYTESASSPGTSQGMHRGVPISPQSPGDIAAPVEIDSRDHSSVTSPSPFSYKTPERKEYPFELP